MDRDERRRLRDVLAEVHPWLEADLAGPTTVPAGECDRCDAEPRLVATCGPAAWSWLGRRCAAQVGLDAWCDGHAADGEAVLAWLGDLPDEADDATRLWWVATGEVRLASIAALVPRALPAAARDKLADSR